MLLDKNPTFILYEKAYTGENFHTTEVNGYIEAHKLLNDTNVFLGGSSYLYLKDAYHKEILIWSAHLENEDLSSHDSNKKIANDNNINPIKVHYDSCDLAQLSKNIFLSLDEYLKLKVVDLSTNALNEKDTKEIDLIISKVLENSDSIIRNNHKTNKF